MSSQASDSWLLTQTWSVSLAKCIDASPLVGVNAGGGKTLLLPCVFHCLNG